MSEIIKAPQTNSVLLSRNRSARNLVGKSSGGNMKQKADRTLQVQSVFAKLDMSRTRKLEMESNEELIEVWYTARLWNKMVEINTKIIDKLSVVPWLYVILFVRALSVAMFLCLGIVIIVLSPSNLKTYGVLSLYITSQLALSVILIRTFRDVCIRKFESCTNLTAFLIVNFVNIILCPKIGRAHV